MNLRKKKVKIGSSKKITRVDEKHPSVCQYSQSAETEPCASLKYTKCIYQNMETGHLYLKILDNPHEKTISESSQNKE